MSVMITCPACQRAMKGPDSIIGKTVKCPACQTQFAVTGGPPPEPVAAPLAGVSEMEVPHSGSTGGKSWFVEFLLFRHMIAPFIIQFIFWIGTIIVVVVGLYLVVISLANIGVPGALAGVLFGLLYVLFGPLVIRIYCETLIIFFRMYETMR